MLLQGFFSLSSAEHIEMNSGPYQVGGLVLDFWATALISVQTQASGDFYI